MPEKKLENLQSLPFESQPLMELLCVHGLNQNPSAMLGFLRALQKKGIHCHLLHLPDHWRKNESVPVCGPQDIRRAYEQAFEYVKSRCQRHGVPMGFAGYSYGGLLGVSHLESYRPDRMVLLAPALRLRFYGKALKLALPFLPRVRSFPIGGASTEAHYRFYQKGVPRSVYSSFFKIYEEFQGRYQDMDLTQVPGTVFIQRGDELVSFGGLKKWVATHTPWTFQGLSYEKAPLSRVKHLILDENTLGQGVFSQLVEASAARLLEEL